MCYSKSITSQTWYISAEGLNHYTVVYGINYRKLKNSIVGHWSVYWKSMEDCFWDIHAFSADYKRTKGFCRAPEATINETMETITTNENNTDSDKPTHESTVEEDLMSLFKQYSSFTPPISDWLGADATVVISEASIQGMSTTYHITVQEQTTIILLDAGTNMSVFLQKFLESLPQKPKLLKSHTLPVTSVSGANLGPIVQCHLTFNLDKKCFTDNFIVLRDWWRNFVLGCNW